MGTTVGKRVEVWLDDRHHSGNDPLFGDIVFDDNNFPSGVLIRLDDGRYFSNRECGYSLCSDVTAATDTGATLMRNEPDPEQTRRDLDESAASLIWHTIEGIKGRKPDDRSARDRAYAVTITELEKVFAYFVLFVQHPQNGGE